MRALNDGVGRCSRVSCGFSLLTGLLAAACGGESVRLESPVGTAHRAPQSDALVREHDIFGEQYADTDPSAMTEFRGALAGHGRWRDDPELGTAWVPLQAEVGTSFVPYVTSGRWTWGQNEYVFVSDHPWGWVTFHYGRWMRSRADGWVWIPGRKYAGAWVTWRTGPDGYVGWGPLPAAWYWRDGLAISTIEPRGAGYVYCRTADLFAHDVASRLLGMPQVLTVAARTRPYDPGDGLAVGGASPLAPRGAAAPPPALLGIDEVVEVPRTDAGLVLAWTLAKPASAEAAGYRQPLWRETRLREWVAGSPRYVRRARTAQ